MKTTLTLTAAALSSACLTGQARAVTSQAFANGGFEDVAGSLFVGWQSAAAGYDINTTDPRSGNNALELSSPAENSAVALQNSVADGGQPDLIPGETASFSFWAKGTAGATGNVLYALRFLNSEGAILSDTGLQFFQDDINENDYTQIIADDVVIPEGANAAFVEFSQAIGPIGEGPAGEDFFPGLVLIDDVVLSTSAGGFDPADLDQDGDVDDADFGLFFAAFSGPGVPTGNPAADLDGDTDTDDADFGLAFAAFTGPGGAVSVPEPASLALLGLGGLLAMRRRA